MFFRRCNIEWLRFFGEFASSLLPHTKKLNKKRFARQARGKLLFEGCLLCVKMKPYVYFRLAAKIRKIHNTNDGS